MGCRHPLFKELCHLLGERVVVVVAKAGGNGVFRGLLREVTREAVLLVCEARRIGTGEINVQIPIRQISAFSKCP